MPSVAYSLLGKALPFWETPTSLHVVHTHPSGSGFNEVSTASTVALGGRRRDFGASDSRSARIRARRSAPVPVGRFASRQSRVSSPVTAALSSARRKVSRPWRARSSAASPSAISALAHGDTEPRAEVHLLARLDHPAGFGQLAVDRRPRAVFGMKNVLPRHSAPPSCVSCLCARNQAVTISALPVPAIG